MLLHVHVFLLQENRNATHQVSGSKKRGGAISALGTRNLTSCIEIINTTIEDSCAPTGGAFYIRNSNFTMCDSQCLNNTAKNGRGGCGRIAGFGSSIIKGSRLGSNCAETAGGALFYYNGILGEADPDMHSITNSTFFDNEVKSEYGVGGAFVAVQSIVFVGATSFLNNSATIGGAAFFSDYFEVRRRSLRMLSSPQRMMASENPRTYGYFYDGCKFSSNIAVGGEELPGLAQDIYAEEGEVSDANVTCTSDTEFCDSCNSTSSTFTNYPPSICGNGLKKKSELCLGESCIENQDTCSNDFLAETTANCSEVEGVGDTPVCCIVNDGNCIPGPFFGSANCCGNYQCKYMYSDGGAKCKPPTTPL